MDGPVDRYSPKLIRFAESAVVTLMTDGALSRGESDAWDGWRNGPAPRQDGGYLSVPADVSTLFRRALSREASRLEAALAVRDDPEDGNDLAMIQNFLQPRQAG